MFAFRALFPVYSRLRLASPGSIREAVAAEIPQITVVRVRFAGSEGGIGTFDTLLSQGARRQTSASDSAHCG